MYSNLVNKVMYTYSNMQDWYLRIIQYKKEENKKIVRKMYEEQRKRVRELFFYIWELDKYLEINNNYKTYYYEPSADGNFSSGLKIEGKLMFVFIDKTKDYHPDISENIEHYLKYFYDGYVYTGSLTFKESIIEEKCKEIEKYGEDNYDSAWIYRDEIVKELGREMVRVIEEIKKEWEEKNKC